jgi:hypothetical protein
VHAQTIWPAMEDKRPVHNAAAVGRRVRGMGFSFVQLACGHTGSSRLVCSAYARNPPSPAPVPWWSLLLPSPRLLQQRLCSGGRTGCGGGGGQPVVTGGSTGRTERAAWAARRGKRHQQPPLQVAPSRRITQQSLLPSELSLDHRWGLKGARPSRAGKMRQQHNKHRKRKCSCMKVERKKLK